MAAVGQETVSTFMDALKGVGKDKMTSDALIGGAAGIGLNMGANMASGDSGGYVGAAALGGGGGALARAAVRHFDLGPALESTFSKARGLNNFTKSTSDEVDRGAQKIFRNRDGSEGSISAYEDRIAAMQRQSEKQNSKGSPILADSTYQESLALGRRAEELKYKQYSNSVMRHGAGNDELLDQYGQESLDRYSSRLGRETKGKFGTPPPEPTQSPYNPGNATVNGGATNQYTPGGATGPSWGGSTASASNPPAPAPAAPQKPATQGYGTGGPTTFDPLAGNSPTQGIRDYLNRKAPQNSIISSTTAPPAASRSQMSDNAFNKLQMHVSKNPNDTNAARKLQDENDSRNSL